jgi:hypothetical protein
MLPTLWMTFGQAPLMELKAESFFGVTHFGGHSDQPRLAVVARQG